MSHCCVINYVKDTGEGLPKMGRALTNPLQHLEKVSVAVPSVIPGPGRLARGSEVKVIPCCIVNAKAATVTGDCLKRKSVANPPVPLSIQRQEVAF